MRVRIVPGKCAHFRNWTIKSTSVRFEKVWSHSFAFEVLLRLIWTDRYSRFTGCSCSPAHLSEPIPKDSGISADRQKCRRINAHCYTSRSMADNCFLSALDHLPGGNVICIILKTSLSDERPAYAYERLSAPYQLFHISSSKPRYTRQISW